MTTHPWKNRRQTTTLLAITQIKSSHWYWIAGLAIVPLFIAGLFAATVTTQSWFRYDETYFAPDYQELYHSPGAVARQWEQALRSGDSTLVAELTGLGHVPRIEPNPNIILTILLEMDDAGYFHYLYFDIQTYKRSTFYIKEIKNRWVVVPADAFFYWDSGRWQGVFAPLAAVWWLVLIVAGAGISLSRVSAQAREAMLRD